MSPTGSGGVLKVVKACLEALKIHENIKEMHYTVTMYYIDYCRRRNKVILIYIYILIKQT